MRGSAGKAMKVYRKAHVRSAILGLTKCMLVTNRRANGTAGIPMTHLFAELTRDKVVARPEIYHKLRIDFVGFAVQDRLAVSDGSTIGSHAQVQVIKHVSRPFHHRLYQHPRLFLPLNLVLDSWLPAFNTMRFTPLQFHATELPAASGLNDADPCLAFGEPRLGRYRQPLPRIGACPAEQRAHKSGLRVVRPDKLQLRTDLALPEVDADRLAWTSP
mmetsp:Transcript_15784/g.44665  ORF Transcript_15784/g.44665 Transcript_15784/m.44665 type:complete len:216 (-) Transcript_15784:91-738(-)